VSLDPANPGVLARSGMDAPPPALNLVVVRAEDVERTRAFYAALGLVMQRESHGSGPTHYASDVCGLVFEVYPSRPDEPPNTDVRLGFRVDAVDELLPGLVSAGGVVVSAPRTAADGRRAVVIDPDGRKVELVTPPAGHDVGPYLSETKSAP